MICFQYYGFAMKMENKNGKKEEIDNINII